MKLRKRIVLSLCCLCGAFAAHAQGTRTVLTAEVNGWKQELVYFDCVQSPMLHAEFPGNQGEVHHYTFELEEPACMLINGREQVLLCPGDSLHVKLTYEGKKVSETVYSGSDKACAQNKLREAINQVKSEMRFKQQLMTCLVLDQKPAKRMEDARAMYTKAMAITDSATLVPAQAKEYIRAGLEYDLYNSLMEYPQMYANGRGMAIEQQGIGDYWAILGDWKPAPTPVQLLNPEYIGLLMRYYIYDNERKAHTEDKQWKREEKFEDMYAALANYYTTPEIRDAVLYTLICNFIRRGQEIERVEPIIKDYREKYNVKKAYMKIIDSVLE